MAVHHNKCRCSTKCVFKDTEISISRQLLSTAPQALRAADFSFVSALCVCETLFSLKAAQVVRTTDTLRFDSMVFVRHFQFFSFLFFFGFVVVFLFVFGETMH